MAVRLSALRASRPLPPGRFLVLISVRGWVCPKAIVRLEGLGQLKIWTTYIYNIRQVAQGLRPLKHWNRGFELISGYGHLFLFPFFTVHLRWWDFVFSFLGQGNVQPFWYAGHQWVYIGGTRTAWENGNTLKETCSNATLSTTNPTWPALGSNPDCPYMKLRINRLIYMTIHSVSC
jgi:hypothetical protein